MGRNPKFVDRVINHYIGRINPEHHYARVDNGFYWYLGSNSRECWQYLGPWRDEGLQLLEQIQDKLPQLRHLIRAADIEVHSGT